MSRSAFGAGLALTLASGASLAALTGGARAQAVPVIDVCSGGSITLPVLNPVASVVDSSVIAGLVNPLLGNLVGNVNASLTNALSGRQLSVSLLDANGNLVSVPSQSCAVTIPSQKGITLGGGRIEGLGGNGAGASAGSLSAIAIGNGAVTTGGLADAVALGSGANAGATGAVALGSGSRAARLNAPVELFSGSGLRSTLGAVSVGDTGLERQITNVAGGTALTDAVNVRQLFSVGNNLATALGGGAGFSITTGGFTAPSYVIGGSTYRDVGSALAAIALVSNNVNTNVVVNGGGSTLIQQGSRNAPITIGQVTGGTVINVTGLDGNRTITGVAAGAVNVTSSDAVNGSQLFARDRGIFGTTAALGGGAAWDPNSGSFTAPTYSVNGRSYDNVGSAIGALDATGVKYDVDPATGRKGNSVTLAGGDPNAPVLLRNVAPGILNTDAANVGQVRAAQQTAMAYTDQKAAQTLGQANAYTDAQVAKLGSSMTDGFNLLTQQVRQARTEAHQAAAVGLAAAALRFDDRPGKLSVAAGGSGWQGQGAAAFGVGYTTPDGFARVNVSASSAGSQWGIGGGLSLTLN